GSGTVVVNTLAPPVAFASTNAPVCNGFGLTLFGDNYASGQSNGNTWSWKNPGNVTFSSAQNPSISNATSANAGTYTLTVTNSLGCTASSPIAVSVNPNPVLSVAAQTNISCNGFSDGSVDIDANNGTPSYLYDLDFGNISLDGIYPGLTPGTHYVDVTDDNGCVSASSLIVNITEPAVLSFSTTFVNTSCIASTDGSINVNAAGGTTSYQYSNDNGLNFQNSNTFTTLATGNYNIVVKDAHNCTTAPSAVTIGTSPDVLAPVPDVSSLSNTTGECSATTVIVPTATDNCAGIITATTNDALSYSNQGTYILHWNYNDGNGNISSQNQTVIVDDVTAPVPNAVSLATITGECSAAAASVPTATDNCAGIITATTSDATSYSTEGTYTILWNFNDGNGNTSSQNQTVIIDDVTAPIPNAASLTTLTDECSVSASAPTATDNCAGIITATTSDAISYSAEGTYTIHWIYNDGKGNTTSQNQTVIIDDITAPIPDVVSLSTLTAECTAIAIAPTATDNCAGVITATTSDATSYSAEGTYTILWNYNDGHGNTVAQNQTVIVDDVTAPVPNIASLPAITGECSVTATAPTATDNCSGIITGTTGDITTYNVQGAYTIQWNYNDGKGNSSTQNQTVIVHDITAPVFNNVPSDFSSCNPVSWVVPSATDNCSSVSITSNHNPGENFAAGTTTVTYVAYDDNGNSSSAVFYVTLLPAPTAVISGNINNCFGSTANIHVDFTGTGPWNYTITDGSQTVSGTAVTASSNISILPSSIGVHTYTVASVTDANCSVGGTSTGSAIVAVSSTGPANNIGTINSPLSACNGDVISISSNTVGGQNIRYSWNTGSSSSIVKFSANSSGPFVNGPFITTSNTVYAQFGALAGSSGYNVCVKAFNGCGNTNNKCKWIRGIVGVPGTITGSVVACSGDTKSYTAGIAGGASIYNWTFSVPGTVITNNGNQTVSVAFPTFTSGQLCVTAALSCGGSSASAPRCMNISNSPALPGIMIGPNKVCPGATSVSYSVPAVAGASGYNWTVPPGATIVETPPYTNSIHVDFPVPYNNSPPVCVSAFSSCGSSSTRCRNVTSSLPLTPGPISGPTAGICNSTVQYSIANVSGATGFTWIVPTGATNLIGQGSTSIQFNMPAPFTSGYVRVTANNNACTPGSSSPRNLLVSGAPTMPTTIITLGEICDYQFGSAYVDAVISATSYNWILTNGSIDYGQGTNNIDYTWGQGTGTIKVRAANACGNSGLRVLDITPTCRGAENIISTATNVSAYPNPAQDKIILSFNSGERDNIVIQIRDFSGRIVQAIKHDAEKGLNELNIDLNNFAKGAYFIQLKSDKINEQLPIIIQ
ncbi:MAG: T9SS type A sorting domain-containing protein, partial [Bacteroidota bacterium]